MGRPILSCKWILSIARELQGGSKRPRDLLRRIPGIKERVLYERLSRLLSLGYLERCSNNSYPLVTYYRIKDPTFKALADLLAKVDISPEDLSHILSCKYTMEILDLLKERRRPKELLSILKGIPEKTLYLRLSSLERMGLVRRDVLPAKPVDVTYILTEEGRGFLPSLLSLSRVILSSQKRQSPSPLAGRGS